MLKFVVLGITVCLLSSLSCLLFKSCFKIFFSVPLMMKGLGCKQRAYPCSFPKFSNRQIQSQMCRINSPDFWCL